MSQHSRLHSGSQASTTQCSPRRWRRGRAWRYMRLCSTESPQSTARRAGDFKQTPDVARTIVPLHPVTRHGETTAELQAPAAVPSSPTGRYAFGGRVLFLSTIMIPTLALLSVVSEAQDPRDPAFCASLGATWVCTCAFQSLRVSLSVSIATSPPCDLTWKPFILRM